MVEFVARGHIIAITLAVWIVLGIGALCSIAFPELTPFSWVFLGFTIAVFMIHKGFTGLLYIVMLTLGGKDD